METTNIIYTCPECGKDLVNTVIATLPSIERWECSECGWYYEEGQQKEIIRIPFNPTMDRIKKEYGFEPLKDCYRANPCSSCSNNPMNGGSGVCHCILGQPVIRC